MYTWIHLFKLAKTAYVNIVWWSGYHLWWFANPTWYACTYNGHSTTTPLPTHNPRPAHLVIFKWFDVNSLVSIKPLSRSSSHIGLVFNVSTYRHRRIYLSCDVYCYNQSIILIRCHIRNESFIYIYILEYQQLDLNHS